MTIFRFSALVLGLVVGACGLTSFKPRNELEGLLQGNVNEVIASLEKYIALHENDRSKLETELREAGFEKGEFIESSTEFDETRVNCQFYSYRRKDGLIFGASAVVWLCDEGSGANFGYIGP